MNFKDKLTDKEIEYLLSLVESDYEEVAQYVDSKELEKEDREQYIYYCEQYAMIDNLRKKLDSERTNIPLPSECLRVTTSQ